MGLWGVLLSGLHSCIKQFCYMLTLSELEKSRGFSIFQGMDDCNVQNVGF